MPHRISLQVRNLFSFFAYSAKTRLVYAMAALLVISGSVIYWRAQANSTAQTLPFTQNWATIAQITANDDWSSVAGIEGFLGDRTASGTTTDIDPQTVLDPLTTIDVIANQTNPNTNTTGGVAEFHTTSQAMPANADPTIALQGSGTADHPNIILYLNTVGQMNINVAYNLRDIDCAADNAVQPVALQYRIGNSGNFINLSGGFVADATTGPSLCTLVTPISVMLPAATNDQPVVQVRIITSNANGSDEWVGIDDINVTGVSIPVVTITAQDSSAAEAGSDTGTFRITRTGATTSALTVNYSISGSAINGTDYTPSLTGSVNIPISASFIDIAITPFDDMFVEGPETATLTLTDTADYNLGATISADVNIADNDTPPTVSINAQDATASEPGADTGTFRITRGGPTVSALNVAYTIGGSASNGTDYMPMLTGTVTIPINASFVDITITPTDDMTVEGSETVILTVTDTMDYDLGMPTSATVTITDNDLPPTVSINDVSKAEGDSGDTIFTFTVTATAAPCCGSDGFFLLVNTMDGTATTANNDYVALVNQFVTISPGNTTATFDVIVKGDTTIEPDETFKVILEDATSFLTSRNSQSLQPLQQQLSEFTILDGEGLGTILNDDITLIHDIQGSVETPNFVGQSRTIRGIVVGDFQGPSGTGLQGFFVQEENTDADANVVTSEGIFVVDGNTPAVGVNVGDQVTVTGTVANTNGLTQMTSPTVVVNNSGNVLPTITNVLLPVTTSAAVDFEPFEGMLVRFTNQTLFVTDNDDLGAFGELSLSSGSALYIPTNAIDPNDNPASGNTITGNTNVAAVTAQQTANNKNRIILDDGKGGSNPSPLPFIGAGTNATVRRGDSVANLTGIMSFGFSNYRI
ncbi:MAG: hypothetical protein HOP19_11040 [Acidobacteria bacterium]|nr:hypothetical protein [Acidobacteriota bacterium]